MCRNRWHISETSGRLSRSLVSLKICGAINFCLVTFILKSATKHSSRSLSNYYDYRGYTNKSLSQLIHFPFHSACYNICILFKQWFYLRVPLNVASPFPTSIYFYSRFFTFLFGGLRRLCPRTAINYSSRPNLFGSQQFNCFIIRFLTATSANPRQTVRNRRTTVVIFK